MKKMLLAMVLVFATWAAHANNVQVLNVSLNGQVAASDYSKVNFDISWDNSWRTSTNESNYDGCWVFVKFRKQGSSLWQHATLNYVSPGTAAACGHTQPTGSTIKQAADGKGMWIYRSANGMGSNYFANASLRWNYGVDGVLDNDSVEVRVFAVEMVYVPQGSFYLGSGGSSTNEFATYGSGAPTTNPYWVTSNSAIQVGASTGFLYYPPQNGYQGDGLGPIPAAYPKGFNAFWIMKYECSQKQYVDFLASLDNARYNTRDNGVDTGTYPAIGAGQPERAMYSLSMADMLAYADWSGMRPCSEMEYEKACRGANQIPVPNEYPWGNTTITNIGVIFDDGLETEFTNSGNCNYFTSTPRRCGIFATPTSDRVASGATYYGAMEMAGNVDELTISVGTPEARLFSATVHGDGTLGATGETNNATWLSFLTTYSCAHRGAGYNVGNSEYCSTSNRVNGSYPTGYTRYAASGIRVARTAE